MEQHQQQDSTTSGKEDADEMIRVSEQKQGQTSQPRRRPRNAYLYPLREEDEDSDQKTSSSSSSSSNGRFGVVAPHVLARQEQVCTYDNTLSIRQVGEIQAEYPAYLRVLPQKQQQQQQQDKIATQKACPGGDQLWVSGFSARQNGVLCSANAAGGDAADAATTAGRMTKKVAQSVNRHTRKSLSWPNEVAPVPSKLFTPKKLHVEHPQEEKNNSFQDALLVADGFLVPGKDRGGIYIVKKPGVPQEEEILSVTKPRQRWFYHKSSWVDLTGDGRQSILTARCRVNFNLFKGGISTVGELVWLECPQATQCHPETGAPLEQDGVTPFDPLAPHHLPWKEHVLVEGPDTMFSVVDMDATDDTIEVICTEFFNGKVTLKSIRPGGFLPTGAPEIVFERVIDDKCGRTYSCVPAALDTPAPMNDAAAPTVLDSGSTAPGLQEGDGFSHILVTNHIGVESDYPLTRPEVRTTTTREQDHQGDEHLKGGGSLFAYRVPRGTRHDGDAAWKTEPWVRSTIATGFKFHKDKQNHPGAPGFVYAFHAQKPQQDGGRARGERPLIAVAGDNSHSAYVFCPNEDEEDASENAGATKPGQEDSNRCTSYKLMFEIKCGATVGSIGVGYDDFGSDKKKNAERTDDASAAGSLAAPYAKLYIPYFEKEKVCVYALGKPSEKLHP